MGKILPFTREPLEPETLTLATTAYDKAVRDVDSAPLFVRELVAKNIIRLIAEGERDAKVLHQRALASVGIAALVDLYRFRLSMVPQVANENG